MTLGGQTGSAHDVAQELRAAFATGRTDTDSGERLPLIDRVHLEDVRPDPEGQVVLSLLRWDERPELLFGHRTVLTLPDGRWDAATAEHADLLLMEAVGTGYLERAALRAPDDRGVYWM